MRKTLGYTLLVVSCLAWVAILAVPFLGVSASRAAAITTGLVVGAEVAFLLSIALLGRQVWDRIKNAFSKRRQR